MRKYLFAILLTYYYSSFSQVKKVVYYNENQKEISETDFFKQKNNQRNLDIYFENDSLVSSFLVTRKNHGQLNDIELKSLNDYLYHNSEATNELTILVYYPGKDRCNGMERISTWNIFDGDYLRKLKKINSYDHFWIYKSDENLKYYHPKQVKGQSDQNQLVEKMFFKFHYPCFSFVILNKKGKYLSYFGEFSKNTVWELSKEFTEMNP